jgi:hypothetical protein
MWFLTKELIKMINDQTNDQTMEKVDLKHTVLNEAQISDRAKIFKAIDDNETQFPDKKELRVLIMGFGNVGSYVELIKIYFSRKGYETRFICFDNDPQSLEQAKKSVSGEFNHEFHLLKENESFPEVPPSDVAMLLFAAHHYKNINLIPYDYIYKHLVPNGVMVSVNNSGHRFDPHDWATKVSSKENTREVKLPNGKLKHASGVSKDILSKQKGLVYKDYYFWGPERTKELEKLGFDAKRVHTAKSNDSKVENQYHIFCIDIARRKGDPEVQEKEGPRP